MKKKNFFRNCNAGRMLLVIVCLAALFASPQRAWADDDKVSVTIDGNTTKYGIVDEAMIAVNAATSNVTVKLLTAGESGSGTFAIWEHPFRKYQHRHGGIGNAPRH